MRMLIYVAGLALMVAAPLAAQDAAAPPAPEPQTAQVVLETTLGVITIALETERTPVTAGNFLRYVDEGRFDGTAFYRAMKLDWPPHPNGLIQGGTRMDPERILEPIAHEPTNETGVRHTRGALSMARYEPGTATGDFSIMLQDMPSMDADPASPDPALRPGFAAFGHVVAGMEVVEAIYHAPIDPEKGQGFMKGEMLAEEPAE
jgi:peptidyl-prolyl cis-trans isomerase A (cyclophilin A)